MKRSVIIYRIFTWLIGLVWLINGLFCKVLDLVPRHRKIVAAILGESHQHIFTIAIGVGEIMIFIWIISRIKPKVCAIFQVLMVGTMNLVEFFAVPDLLLFGKLNLCLAIIFIFIILWHESLREKYARNIV